LACRALFCHTSNSNSSCMFFLSLERLPLTWWCCSFAVLVPAVLTKNMWK
jgi:hypothetical protein